MEPDRLADVAVTRTYPAYQSSSIGLCTTSRDTNESSSASNDLHGSKTPPLRQCEQFPGDDTANELPSFQLPRTRYQGDFLGSTSLCTEKVPSRDDPSFRPNDDVMHSTRSAVSTRHNAGISKAIHQNNDPANSGGRNKKDIHSSGITSDDALRSAKRQKSKAIADSGTDDEDKDDYAAFKRLLQQLTPGLKPQMPCPLTMENVLTRNPAPGEESTVCHGTDPTISELLRHVYTRHSILYCSRCCAKIEYDQDAGPSCALSRHDSWAAAVEDAGPDIGNIDGPSRKVTLETPQDAYKRHKIEGCRERCISPSCNVMQREEMRGRALLDMAHELEPGCTVMRHVPQSHQYRHIVASIYKTSEVIDEPVFAPGLGQVHDIKSSAFPNPRFSRMAEAASRMQRSTQLLLQQYQKLRTENATLRQENQQLQERLAAVSRDSSLGKAAMQDLIGSLCETMLPTYGSSSESRSTTLADMSAERFLRSNVLAHIGTSDLIRKPLSHVENSTSWDTIKLEECNRAPANLEPLSVVWFSALHWAAISLDKEKLPNSLQGTVTEMTQGKQIHLPSESLQSLKRLPIRNTSMLDSLRTNSETVVGKVPLQGLADDTTDAIMKSRSSTSDHSEADTSRDPGSEYSLFCELRDVLQDVVQSCSWDDICGIDPCDASGVPKTAAADGRRDTDAQAGPSNPTNINNRGRQKRKREDSEQDKHGETGDPNVICSKIRQLLAKLKKKLGPRIPCPMTKENALEDHDPSNEDEFACSGNDPDPSTMSRSLLTEHLIYFCINCKDIVRFQGDYFDRLERSGVWAKKWRKGDESPIAAERTHRKKECKRRCIWNGCADVQGRLLEEYAHSPETGCLQPRGRDLVTKEYLWRFVAAKIHKTSRIKSPRFEDTEAWCHVPLSEPRVRAKSDDVVNDIMDLLESLEQLLAGHRQSDGVDQALARQSEIHKEAFARQSDTHREALAQQAAYIEAQHRQEVVRLTAERDVAQARVQHLQAQNNVSNIQHAETRELIKRYQRILGGVCPRIVPEPYLEKEIRDLMPEIEFMQTRQSVPPVDLDRAQYQNLFQSSHMAAMPQASTFQFPSMSPGSINPLGMAEMGHNTLFPHSTVSNNTYQPAQYQAYISQPYVDPAADVQTTTLTGTTLQGHANPGINRPPALLVDPNALLKTQTAGGMDDRLTMHSQVSNWNPAQQDCKDTQEDFPNMTDVDVL